MLAVLDRKVTIRELGSTAKSSTFSSPSSFGVTVDVAVLTSTNTLVMETSSRGFSIILSPPSLRTFTIPAESRTKREMELGRIKLLATLTLSVGTLVPGSSNTNIVVLGFSSLARKVSIAGATARGICKPSLQVTMAGTVIVSPRASDVLVII